MSIIYSHILRIGSQHQLRSVSSLSHLFPDAKQSDELISWLKTGPEAVGKRRGGNKLALKTGIVAKKQKTEDEVLTSKGDAWAKYMAEVKKYKAHQCGDDDKTRPLVK
uniref:Telomerase RNA component interacting RNase n=1 Tax=Molossus molossus TaxID=27622 RepID=A0A7J8ID96_MOLMO|nr:telomerase RNA component interacting RNase [Molossus molossus]